MSTGEEAPDVVSIAKYDWVEFVVVPLLLVNCCLAMMLESTSSTRHNMISNDLRMVSSSCSSQTNREKNSQVTLEAVERGDKVTLPRYAVPSATKSGSPVMLVP